MMTKKRSKRMTRMGAVCNLSSTMTVGRTHDAPPRVFGFFRVLRCPPLLPPLPSKCKIIYSMHIKMKLLFKYLAIHRKACHRNR